MACAAKVAPAPTRVKGTEVEVSTAAIPMPLARAPFVLYASVVAWPDLLKTVGLTYRPVSKFVRAHVSSGGDVAAPGAASSQLAELPRPAACALLDGLLCPQIAGD